MREPLKMRVLSLSSAFQAAWWHRICLTWQILTSVIMSSYHAEWMIIGAAAAPAISFEVQ
jgi:hypothetical protein